MSKLPDFEALAVFAKVVEMRSFAAAALDLGVSKATVSKAVSRLETRLGARLFNRTSRRLALTDAGQRLAEPAARILAEGHALEDAASAQSAAPRGLVRLAAPMSFGLAAIVPILPAFLAEYPDISIDLHLSDATVDIIGEGFDAALRVAVLPDSSLRARRLCDVSRFVVAAPAYFDRYGRPSHPSELAEHRCLGYAYVSTPDTWHFANAAGELASVRPTGPLRANNGDALMPALYAGLGLAILPDFIAGAAILAGQLEAVLTEWMFPVAGLHLVTPPGGPRPARVGALLDYLARRLSRTDHRPDNNI
jgi:DNA-binding transcriptional LysR family regulator